MCEATKAFEAANEDCSNVIETFLEPLRLNLELPDYSRLDKPKKPPVPEVEETFLSGFCHFLVLLVLFLLPFF